MRRLRQWLIAAVLLLALGGITTAALRWMPFSDGFSPVQETVEDGNPGTLNAKTKSAVPWPDEGFQGQMEEVLQRSRKLDAEMRQPVLPSQANDSALPWLREAQERLEKLERELGASTPGK